jgi:hypothetical protein
MTKENRRSPNWKVGFHDEWNGFKYSMNCKLGCMNVNLVHEGAARGARHASRQSIESVDECVRIHHRSSDGGQPTVDAGKGHRQAALLAFIGPREADQWRQASCGMVPRGCDGREVANLKGRAGRAYSQ